MPILQTLDGSLTYDTSGNRTDPAVLLLHGILGTYQSELAPLAERLALTHYVVGIDFRMHGRSIAPADAFTMQGLCDDVLAVLNAEGITQAHVVGYSLGGYVALQLERTAPGSILSIYMHGTKFYWTDAAINAFTHALDPEVIRAKQPRWADRLESLHASQGTGHWQDLCRAASAMILGLAGHFPEDALASVTVPVCVSIGDRDELVPIDEAVALFRALPAGSLAVLPATRHPLPSADADLLAHHVRKHMLRAAI